MSGGTKEEKSESYTWAGSVRHDKEVRFHYNFCGEPWERLTKNDLVHILERSLQLLCSEHTLGQKWTSSATCFRLDASF